MIEAIQAAAALAEIEFLIGIAVIGFGYAFLGLLAIEVSEWLDRRRA